MHFPTHRAFLYLAAAITLMGGARGQRVLPLNGPYHIGQIRSYYDTGPTCTYVATQEGTLTFAPNGTYTVVSTVHEVCNGVPGSYPINDNGGWTVDEAGLLTLDEDLSNPGTSLARFHVRADGKAAALARSILIDESFVVIMLKASTGQSNASLSGSYRVVRLTNVSAPTLSLSADLGSITFNGMGGWSEAGTRQAVTDTGATSSAPYTANGTYVVSPDGSLALPGFGAGGIADNGDVFFWMTGSGTSVGLTIGVRQSSTAGISALAGRWGTADYQQELGASETLSTGFGVFNVVAGGPLNGTYQGTSFDVETTPQSTTSGTSNESGAVTIQANGRIQFVDQSQFAVDGAVDPRGTFLVVHEIEPAVGGLAFGVRLPNPPVRYGVATPGTGGIAPDVTYADGRGFPIDNNFGFAMKIFAGRGGAAAALLLSLGPSAGFPFFGGIINVDPVLIFAAPPKTLSGANGGAGVGEGTLSLALPLGTEGLQFFVQPIVLDPNTPAGLAMGKGVGVLVGR